MAGEYWFDGTRWWMRINWKHSTGAAIHNDKEMLVDSGAPFTIMSRNNIETVPPLDARALVPGALAGQSGLGLIVTGGVMEFGVRQPNGSVAAKTCNLPVVYFPWNGTNILGEDQLFELTVIEIKDRTTGIGRLEEPPAGAKGKFSGSKLPDVSKNPKTPIKKGILEKIEKVAPVGPGGEKFKLPKVPPKGETPAIPPPKGTITLPPPKPPKKEPPPKTPETPSEGKKVGLVPPVGEPTSPVFLPHKIGGQVIPLPPFEEPSKETATEPGMGAKVTGPTIPIPPIEEWPESTEEATEEAPARMPVKFVEREVQVEGAEGWTSVGTSYPRPPAEAYAQVIDAEGNLAGWILKDPDSHTGWVLVRAES